MSHGVPGCGRVIPCACLNPCPRVCLDPHYHNPCYECGNHFPSLSYHLTMAESYLVARWHDALARLTLILPRSSSCLSLIIFQPSSLPPFPFSHRGIVAAPTATWNLNDRWAPPLPPRNCRCALRSPCCCCSRCRSSHCCWPRRHQQTRKGNLLRQELVSEPSEGGQAIEGRRREADRETSEKAEFSEAAFIV